MVARQRRGGGLPPPRRCPFRPWHHARVDELTIRPLEARAIEHVRPLWEALLEHHGNVAPPVLPATRDPAESWRRRRAEYDVWLAEPGSFTLVAEAKESLIGYTLVRLEDGDDTWSTDERVAVIETLSVDPAWRGRGVGTALMDAVDEELARAGIRDLFVGAVATNRGAMRFYERRGLTATLVHFYGRRSG